MLLFQMAWCYMNNRQDEYFTENMAACGHHYGSHDHLSAVKITFRPHSEKKNLKKFCVCLCACIKAHMYAFVFAQNWDAQMSNTCRPVSHKL